MNIQSNINKLLIGIKLKGKRIKLDSKIFFSDKAGRYITKYILYERVPSENKYGEPTEKWEDIWDGYSKPRLLEYLAYYYKEMGSEANE